MSVLRPDLLYPIFDKNRDEIFLVEYEGFIKNIVEGIVLSMLFTKQRWIDMYPKLTEFKDILNGEVYDKTMLYINPLDYLNELSNDTLSDTDILKDIQELEKMVDIIQYQQCTIVEFAVQSLLKQKFVKKCIFLKSTPFNNNEIKYIASVFKDSINKINIFSGPTEEVFESYEPTTCFINSFNTINKCIQIGNVMSMKDKLFILRNTNENVYYSNVDKLFRYKTEFINNVEIINKGKVYYIAPMYTYRQESVDIKESLG